MKIKQVGREVQARKFKKGRAKWLDGLKAKRIDDNYIVITLDKDNCKTETLGFISADEEVGSDILSGIVTELISLIGRDDMRRPVSELTEADRQEVMRAERELAKEQKADFPERLKQIERQLHRRT